MQVRKSDLKKVVREVLNEAPKEDPHDYTVLAAVVMDAINEFMTSSKERHFLRIGILIRVLYIKVWA